MYSHYMLLCISSKYEYIIEKNSQGSKPILEIVKGLLVNAITAPGPVHGAGDNSRFLEDLQVLRSGGCGNRQLCGNVSTKTGAVFDQLLNNPTLILLDRANNSFSDTFALIFQLTPGDFRTWVV